LRRFAVRQAAKLYGIPYTTLYDHIESGDIPKLKLIRPPIFKKTEEREMTEHIILLSVSFYGLTKADLPNLALMHAEILKLAHNFCSLIKCVSGHWLVSFMRRSPGTPFSKYKQNYCIERKTNQNILCESGGFYDEIVVSP
jgi:hypothetical protein